MKDVVRLAIAIPPEIKAWLVEEAKLDDRTQNGVVVKTLRDAMNRRRAA